jgi:hypothetical protein
VFVKVGVSPSLVSMWMAETGSSARNSSVAVPSSAATVVRLKVTGSGPRASSVSSRGVGSVWMKSQAVRPAAKSIVTLRVFLATFVTCTCQ